MTNLDEYDGIYVGSIVSIDGLVHERYTRAKVMRIYRDVHRRPRFVVKVADGSQFDIPLRLLEKFSKPCKCEVLTLMRMGCQCDGY